MDETSFKRGRYGFTNSVQFFGVRPDGPIGHKYRYAFTKGGIDCMMVRMVYFLRATEFSEVIRGSTVHSIRGTIAAKNEAWRRAHYIFGSCPWGGDPPCHALSFCLRFILAFSSACAVSLGWSAAGFPSFGIAHGRPARHPRLDWSGHLFRGQRILHPLEP
jgi:hypothetical protein